MKKQIFLPSKEDLNKKICHWCGKLIKGDDYQIQSYTGRFFHGDPNNGCSKKYLDSEGL